jgi:hypothetical protein
VEVEIGGRRPAAKRIPPGAIWRILYHEAPTKRDGMCGPAHDLHSVDYPTEARSPQDPKVRTIFDELVIAGLLHLEQMSRDTWCLIVGEDKCMISVGRDGKPKMGEWYK